MHKGTTMTRLNSIPCLAAGALLLGSFSLGAANTNQWETSAAAGLTLTRGNSETLLGNISLNSSRKWPVDEVLLGASGTYGEQKIDSTDKTETTAASAEGFGQYNHLFNEGGTAVLGWPPCTIKSPM